MKMLIQKFWQDEAGLTAVEYAVAGGLVIAALVTAFTDLGQAVADKIQVIIDAIV